VLTTDALRLYKRRGRGRGRSGAVVLDVYEDMVHVFQGLFFLYIYVFTWNRR
jgi:hypothetical protein